MRKALDRDALSDEGTLLCVSSRVGEERAYWSLGNAYTCLGEHRQARHYAEKHLQLATELGDEEGAAIARKNLHDLDNALELSDKSVES